VVREDGSMQLLGGEPARITLALGELSGCNLTLALKRPHGQTWLKERGRHGPDRLGEFIGRKVHSQNHMVVSRASRERGAHRINVGNRPEEQMLNQVGQPHAIGSVESRPTREPHLQRRAGPPLAWRQQYSNFVVELKSLYRSMARSTTSKHRRKRQGRGIEGSGAKAKHAPDYPT